MVGCLLCGHPSRGVCFWCSMPICVQEFKRHAHEAHYQYTSHWEVYRDWWYSK